MKITKILTIAVAVIALTAPAFAKADSQTKSIVLDARGNAVTTREGVCVTHNWPRDNAICHAKAANVDIPNIVYFDFARSTLNVKGQKVVDQVAAGLKALNGGYTSVRLSGYADRVDTMAFNQRLSERRAATVKNALVKRGVPAGKISTIGYGETRNAVPTKDGVAEQLNRRVEIEVNR